MPVYVWIWFLDCMITPNNFLVWLPLANPNLTCQNLIPWNDMLTRMVGWTELKEKRRMSPYTAWQEFCKCTNYRFQNPRGNAIISFDWFLAAPKQFSNGILSKHWQLRFQSSTQNTESEINVQETVFSINLAKNPGWHPPKRLPRVKHSLHRSNHRHWGTELRPHWFPQMVWCWRDPSNNFKMCKSCQIFGQKHVIWNTFCISSNWLVPMVVCFACGYRTMRS